MTHPGLPEFWILIVWGFIIALCVRSLIRPLTDQLSEKTFSLSNIKVFQAVINLFARSVWPLLIIKIISVIFFILVIYSGLKGTAIPERNIATVLTWNIWWAGLIISIFFLGSAWCAICPWNTLATIFVKPHLWFTKQINNSLQITAPKWMRNVWLALIMFVGLTWLELGVGVTVDPYSTALLALLMVVLATIGLAIFKNRAFCHYICPVGRTVGFYAQLAPVELRPKEASICEACTTFECYNGTDKIEACPTQLVMGTLSQNTYCTSCGNCVKSCPDDNVSWRFRSPSIEAVKNARPHWDEAWFMLVLLALTSFHGITMMEFWQQWISQFAQFIGDSGQLLTTFSIGLFISIFVPVFLYTLCIMLMRHISENKIEFKKIFTSLVFVSLPLAFSYHLAHNLNHLIRESVGASQLFLNPLGVGTSPLSFSDTVLKEYNMLISQDFLFALQAMLMMFGFWIATQVLRHRAMQLQIRSSVSLWPMMVFITVIHGFNLWMLSQPMVMRIGPLCIAP